MKSLILILLVTITLTNACIFKSLLGITSSPHEELQAAEN